VIKAFVDFDRTITVNDVGDLMFETFGGSACSRLVDDYCAGRLSACDCFRRECEACGEVDRKTLDRFLDAQEIDPAFAGFVQFCRTRGIELTVVSDGMDYYIDRILKNKGLADISYYANRLELVEVDGTSRVRLQPSFPYRDESCDRCACCKRNHILSMSAEEDIVVYVGDGYSDRCPARYADVVFAKEDLLKYCQSENIPCLQYRTFADIGRRLERMIDRKDSAGGIRLRKRRQAELARCEAYLGG